MIGFITKWVREKALQHEIEEDGSDKKWTKCCEGLPSSDRKVLAISSVRTGPKMSRDLNYEYDYQPKIMFASFNPNIGWNIDGYIGAVSAWKDLDEDTRDLLDDVDLLKKIAQ